jgi:chromosome segregation ATPase
MKSHFLSIICASIIVLGGSFVVVKTILAKDEASELDKKAQESQVEVQKQSQKTREGRPQTGVNQMPSSETQNEAQQKLLERQKEQNQQLTEKQKEQTQKMSEKVKEKEDRPNPNDEGQDDSVDSLSEQITIGPEREKKIKDKCQEISNKITEHQNELKAKAEKRLGKYNKIIARLQSVSVKLAELGVDVTAYNGYVAEVNSKVTDLNTLTQKYIASLQSDSAQLCTKDKAATELNTRKSDLKVIIAQDKAIRTYIKETIIPYLRSIKPQQPASTESANTTTPTNTVPATNTAPIQ